MPGFRSIRRIIAWLALVGMLVASCASLPGTEPPRISVAGIESLAGDGLEIRFNVRLRIQNPNGFDIKYQGILVDLLVDGRRIASGLSGEPGRVPAYGETVYVLPVTVSALNAIRQLIDIAQQPRKSAVRYEIKGKLEGGLFGTVRFSDNGNLTLPK